MKDLKKKMGIREGTQSSNISKNTDENDINNINSKENSKTVYRKIEDYHIKKFNNQKKNYVNSIN